MNQLAWGQEESPYRSLPWRHLSPGKLTVRTLRVCNESTNNKWRETKLMVIVGATRKEDQPLTGKLIYIRRPEELKETQFHTTTFDALLRGAENTDASIKRRSTELSGDAETLRGFCELLGVDWYGVKEDVGKRMALAASLQDMSARYFFAIRSRLQYVSAKSGRTTGLKDKHNPPRDNPSAIRAQWSASARRLDAQYEFNEKAAGSAADMILLSRAVYNWVDELMADLLFSEASGRPNAILAPLRKLKNFVIFDSLGYATLFYKQKRPEQKINEEFVSLIASAFSAEQLMCSVSGLVSLVRDSPEFRTEQTFAELRSMLSWPDFDPSYSDICMQLQVYVDLLEKYSNQGESKEVNKAAKSIKALIRNRTQSDFAVA